MLSRIKGQMNFSKEKISQFYKDYTTRMKRVNELREIQREKVDNYLSWIEECRRVSSELEEICAENEKELAKYIYPIINGKVALNNKIIGCFLEEIKILKEQGIEDSLVSLEVLKVIIAYYEKKSQKNINNFVVALGYAGIYESDFGTEESYKCAIEYNNRVIEYGDMFLDLSELAKERVAYAYMNRIVISSYQRKSNIDNTMKYLKEAECFYTNEKFRTSTNLAFERFLASSIRTAHLQILSLAREKGKCSAGFVNVAAQEEIQAYKRRSRNGQSKGEIENTEDLDYYLAGLHLNRVSPEEVFEKMQKALYSQDRNIDFDDPNYYKRGIFGAFLQIVPEMLVVLSKTSYSSEKKGKLIREIADFVFSTFGDIPYDKRNKHTSRYLIQSLRNILPYCTVQAEEIELIRRMILTNENVSAIHVNLVRSMGKEVTKSIAVNKPSLFVSYNQNETKEDVKKNIGELIQFIDGAAIFYDIGKVTLTELINMRHRKRTKAEEEMIEEHVSIGAEILHSIPELQVYESIALGHHKDYDGQGGYPESYDRKADDNRIWTDIIQICDVADSMAVFRPDNGEEESRFDMFIKKIEEGRGTKYNPDLVDLFFEDKNLNDSIKYLIEEGESMMIYDVYKSS